MYHATVRLLHYREVNMNTINEIQFMTISSLLAVQFQTGHYFPHSWWNISLYTENIIKLIRYWL